MARLVYCDPLTKERFVFITTDPTLRPGVIALLYFLRWKIEKVYDVFKNKLHQQKAWANGSVVSHTQAHLIALTHNLLTLLLSTLESVGCAENKVLRHEAIRRQHRAEHQRVPAQEMVRHATQLTCQFIRLVRHCILHHTPWRIALPLFHARLTAYL